MNIFKPVEKLLKTQSDDPDLTTDVRMSILVQSPRGGRIIIWAVLIFVIFCLVWAYNAEIEEITRGNGKVIPSSQIQVIQNLEGGILAEMPVREGDIVEKGDLLLRIDETRFSAPYRESQVKFLALKAKIIRLSAEAKGEPFEVPDKVYKEYPDIAARENKLYLSRKQELNALFEGLHEQVNQRKQEQAELAAKERQLSRTYRLLQREVKMTEPLVGEGAVSEVELLRLQRQASQMKGELDVTRLTKPRAESRLKEAESEIEEKKLSFQNKVRAELNEAYSVLEGLSVSAVALEDRLDRTYVKSPVRGTINRVLINTIGGVIKPGMDLIEIVPLEDTLLIEARIKPSDIAFLRPNLKAVVKFTAYDFTVYGGLEAELEHISADSILDKRGESYYLVRVRTDKNYLGTESNPLPIIPGMIGSVDILTGKKTILSYLLKPILRAKSLALTER